MHDTPLEKKTKIIFVRFEECQTTKAGGRKGGEGGTNCF